MRPRIFIAALPALLLLAWSPARAQSGSSLVLESWTLNGGGVMPAEEPLQGDSFRLTRAAVGDALAAPVQAAGGSLTLTVGWMQAYRPPGEVLGLEVADPGLLNWALEPASAGYFVYRGRLSGLSSATAGGCWQEALPETATVDGSLPAAGDGFYYLITARNRLGEEGTFGYAEAGGIYIERDGGRCP